MDKNGMKAWNGKVLGKRKQLRLKKKAFPVFDRFWSYLKESVKQKFQHCKTKVAVIPGGLTSQLQTLDFSLNKHRKLYMRRMKQTNDGCQCSSADIEGHSETAYNHTGMWVG